MDEQLRRKMDRERRLKANPPPTNLQGDLTKPHQSRFLECKDIEQASDLPETPTWWTPPKHGMEVKSGKVK